MPELGISEKARKYKFTYWKERLFFCQFKNKEGFENTVRGFKFEVSVQKTQTVLNREPWTENIYEFLML